MAVGTENNNLISGVVCVRVFSVHLQHYRLANPPVQFRDLASVTTCFYEPQTDRALSNRRIPSFHPGDRLLVSYAFVDRDVFYPTAYRSPGYVYLARDAPVSVAGPTQLDRPGILRFSIFVWTAHLYPYSYRITACKVRCLCRLGYAPLFVGEYTSQVFGSSAVQQPSSGKGFSRRWRVHSATTLGMAPERWRAVKAWRHLTCPPSRTPATRVP
jgi:hypothetical protein